MHRYIILLAIIICLLTCSYAQENINMFKILNIEQDIVSLEKEITKLIKKNPDMANMQNLRQFHIFMLEFDGNTTDIKKEKYINHSFLYHLKPRYYDSVFERKKGKLTSIKLKEKYLRTETLITDSEGNLICMKINRMKGCYMGIDYEKLAKMFFNKEFDFVFSIASTQIISYLIGIKDSNLYAIEREKEFKIYSWEKFIECCFNKWIVP